MVACSDTKGSVREGKDSLNPPTPTIKTTTNDGRAWQLEVVKRKYLATNLSTSTAGARRAVEKTNKQKLEWGLQRDLAILLRGLLGEHYETELVPYS